MAAALLGHTSLQTTRGYVAVSDDDIVRHYERFLAHRRALRPAEAYRPATDEEWAEFEAHIDKRQLTLDHLRRKRDQAQLLARRLAGDGPAPLGFPTISRQR